MGYETLNACEVTADLLFEDFLELPPLLDDQKICLKSRHRWDGLTLNLLFINFPSLSISAAITSIIHPIPDWYQNWEISRRWSIFLIQNKIIWGMWMYRTFSVKKCGVIIPFKIFWSFVREEYTYYTPLWILEFNHFLPLLIACKKKVKKYLFLYASLMTSCIYCIVTVSIKGNEDYKITLKISWQKRGLTIQRTQNVKIMLLHSRLFQCRNVKGSHEDEARIEKIFADPSLRTFFICMIFVSFALNFHGSTEIEVPRY